MHPLCLSLSRGDPRVFLPPPLTYMYMHNFLHEKAQPRHACLPGASRRQTPLSPSRYPGMEKTMSTRPSAGASPSQCELLGSLPGGVRCKTLRQTLAACDLVAKIEALAERRPPKLFSKVYANSVETDLTTTCTGFSFNYSLLASEGWLLASRGVGPGASPSSV